jgi:hypothetical protein
LSRSATHANGSARNAWEAAGHLRATPSPMRSPPTPRFLAPVPFHAVRVLFILCPRLLQRHAAIATLVPCNAPVCAIGGMRTRTPTPQPMLSFFSAKSMGVCCARSLGCNLPLMLQLATLTARAGDRCRDVVGCMMLTQWGVGGWQEAYDGGATERPGAD